MRYWHLLGLLLTRAEKWSEAIEILERGAELDDELDDEGAAEEQSARSDSKDALTITPSDLQTLVVPGATDFSPSSLLSENVPGSDAGTLKPGKPRTNGVATPGRGKATAATASTKSVPLLLARDAVEIPVAETLLKAKELSFEDYPASQIELFERHLQLRMSQVALMEVIEGAEGAENGWLEIFSWVAERKGPVSSADGETGLLYV